MMRVPAAILMWLVIQPQTWRPAVPNVWDEDALRELELPRVGLGLPAGPVSADYYYRIPVDRIPKTYPVYAPDREPPGYLEWLRTQEPQDAIDFSRLKSKEDWTRAGQLVFDAPFRAALSGPPGRTADEWRRFSGTKLYPRVAKDGSYPWVRYCSIGDLMRYATLVDVAETLSEYDGLCPFADLPDPRRLGRFSDEALYALALFVYSLQPPPNPHRPNALSQRGESIFHREGCAACHTPSLYTNNKLVAKGDRLLSRPIA